MTCAVYDHLRSTSSEHRDGIYRVVGTAEETVTLLRVSDGDGRRRSTGDVVTVDRTELDSFEPADNPDGNRSMGELVHSAGSTLYWMVRTFAGNLAVHPLSTLVFAVVLLAGYAGPLVADVPPAVETGLVVVGAGGIALVGSGRL